MRLPIAVLKFATCETKSSKSSVAPIQATVTRIVPALTHLFDRGFTGVNRTSNSSAPASSRIATSHRPTCKTIRSGSGADTCPSTTAASNAPITPIAMPAASEKESTYRSGQPRVSSVS